MKLTNDKFSFEDTRCDFCVRNIIQVGLKNGFYSPLKKKDGEDYPIAVDGLPQDLIPYLFNSEYQIFKYNQFSAITFLLRTNLGLKFHIYNV